MNKLKENTEESLKNFISGVEDVFYNSGELENVIERNIETLDFGRWDVRTWYHEPHMFALDVKGKGFGDFDKINKDNRFSSRGYTEESYFDYNQSNNEILFNEWSREFQDEFALDLVAGGRSGGWWGFKIDDLYSSFEYCFQFNEAKLKEFYDNKGLPLFGDASEFDTGIDFYEIGEETADSNFEDVLNMIEFKPEFKKMLEEFANNIDSASASMEGDEYNDEAFLNITGYDEELDDEE